MRHALALCLILASPAAAQTDTCGDYGSQVEMGNCQAAALAASDAELNRVYKRVASEMAAVDADLPAGQKGAVAALKAGQRAWITMRDETCKMVEKQWFGGSGAGLALASCLTELTRNRTGELVTFLPQ